MKKTAFIYDKWLNQFGGGEVVACNIAKILIDEDYEVTFITGFLVDPNLIKTKLNIDISKANFIQVFNDEIKIKDLTKNADIFINISFWDFSLGNAKKNFYYVFFPTKISLNPIKSILTNIVKPYEHSSNQYIFYYLAPNKPTNISFNITLEEFSKTNLENIKWSVDNATNISASVSVNHFNNKIYFNIRCTPNSESIYLNINHQIEISPFPYQNRIFSILRSGYFPQLQKRLEKFDLIFSTSKYTSIWVKKLWKLDSPTIYPPVNFVKTIKSKKFDYITSVGRFFVAGHNKKQEIMIQAFKSLHDQGKTNYELHLAGGLSSEPENQQYFKSLQDLAKGYPIFFHLNKPRDFIEKLLLESKIYWHAAGYGLNQNKHPDKFEHFGITPIEAMSAGCTPVLFNGGGLKELITTLELNPNIHLFDNIDKLVENTRIIIEKNIHLPQDTQQQLEKNYSFDKFKSNLLSQINKD